MTEVKTGNTGPYWKLIGFQLAALSILVVTLSLVAHGLVNINQQIKLTEKNLINQGEIIGSHIAEMAPKYLLAMDLASLEYLAISQSRFNEVARVQIADTEGVIITEIIQPPGESARAVYNPRQISVPAGIKPHATHTLEKYVFWYPINSLDYLQGWVKLELHTHRISGIKQQIWTNTGLLIVFASGLSLFLLISLLRPYVKAIKKATEFAGNLDLHFGQRFKPWQGTHELRLLGESLNDVSLKLATQDTQRSLAETKLRQKEQELEAAQALAHLGSWSWDLENKVQTWSDELYRLFGLLPGEKEPDHLLFIEGIYKDDREKFQTAINSLIDTDTTACDLEFRLHLNNSSIKHVFAQMKAKQDTATDGLFINGSLLDITLRKLSEQALFNEKERAEVTLHSIGDAVITTKVDGHVIFLNPIAEKLTGWSIEDALDKPIDEVFHIINEETRKLASNPVKRCLRDGTIVGLANHTLLISRNGREYAIQDSAAPIRGRQGEVQGVVLVFSDVTEARRLSNELSHQASHDALTGLINRREFERRLRRVRETAQIAETSNVLCFLDLDQFKLVNDTCGHIAGDELLRQISNLMQQSIRVRDTLARLGGDEFGLLMEHCTIDEAFMVAQKIIQKLEKYSFAWDDNSFNVGVSIGLVDVSHDSQDCSSLMSAADTACYVAKERGRNQVHIHQDDDKELASRHREMLWAVKIPQALDKNQFCLYAQPIVPLSGNSSSLHYEVLIRMLNDDNSIILPGAFLPAADRYNISAKIDRWVISHTFEFLANNPKHLEKLDLCAINLSGHSINDETFLEFVREEIKSGLIPAHKICFEITETVAISNLTRATNLINAMHSEGFLFALDDFGSGLSSFAYLKHLPVDLLKIDGQFVKEITRDPIDFAMVKSINEIGQIMGKPTIAEYVENDEILERLRSIGVSYSQGFALGKPQPIENMLGSAHD